MARHLRVQFEGAIYHVTARGSGRRNIYRDNRDKERFLERLKGSLDLHDVRLYAYCMMDNHFHLLLETPRANLSAFMHSVETGYTIYFNKRHHLSGHVMQGRFVAKLVEGDSFLFLLSRYIHLNPVQGTVLGSLSRETKTARLRGYPWSSFRSYAGLAAPVPFVEHGPLLALLPTAFRSRQPSIADTAAVNEMAAAYRQFVEDGLDWHDEAFFKRLNASPFAIGSDAYCAEIEARYKRLAEGFNNQEDISFRRSRPTVAPADIMTICAALFDVNPVELASEGRHAQARILAATMLMKYAMCTQRQAAALLGWRSGAALCMQKKRLLR